MRGLFLVAAIWGAASAAHAADMPDLPVLRGAFTDGLTTSRVNWEGFYVGGQVGYGSSDANFSGSNSAMLASLLDHTLVEQQMGISEWNLQLGKNSSRSVGYGVFVGYNAQWDDVVLGLEASYLHGKYGAKSIASQRRSMLLSDGLVHDVTVDSSAAISISDMATFRGRAAYAWGCFLPYLFAGFALGNADITRSVHVEDVAGPTATGTFISYVPLSASEGLHNHLVYGYTLGLGVDVNLTGGLFMRAEWEYVRFVNQVDTAINTARLGLGYKF